MCKYKCTLSSNYYPRIFLMIILIKKIFNMLKISEKRTFIQNKRNFE